VFEIRDWMTPRPVSIDPGAPIREAFLKLHEGGFRHLPVTHENRVVGVLNARNLNRAFPSLANEDRIPSVRCASHELRVLADRPESRVCLVGEVMSYDPILVSPTCALERAAAVLDERGPSCLIVVDEHRHLLGIATNGDLLAAVVALLRGGTRGTKPLAELARLARELRAERSHIAAELEGYVSSARLLSYQLAEDPAAACDWADSFIQISLEGSLADLAASRLADLDRALDRYERGILSACVRCGGSIDIGRLRARPSSRSCRNCAAHALDAAHSLRDETRNASIGRPATRARVHAHDGQQVQTPYGDGQLLRLSLFGTCGGCGEVEGTWDADGREIVCGSPECELPLTDVQELAIVQIGELTAAIPPEALRPVDDPSNE